MLSWLRQRLVGAIAGSSPAPYFPAMFRVRDPEGQFVELVEISGVCEPSGSALQTTKRTAEGLCLLHWPGRSRLLRLTLRSGAATADVEITSHRTEPDRVIEVQLQA